MEELSEPRIKQGSDKRALAARWLAQAGGAVAELCCPAGMCLLWPQLGAS